MTARTSRRRTGPTNLRPSQPRYCNQVVGCPTRVILARRFPGGAWRAYEANDVPTTTPGAHVLIAGQAWRPQDLAEDFQTRYAITATAARELVEGYPFHLPHRHHHEERHRP